MNEKPSVANPTSKTSRVINVDSKSKVEDISESDSHTEIVAPISIPTEGGWGWVVVAAAFCNLFILDGITFTFGTLLTSIKNDFEIEVSLAALLGSTEGALYFILSPFASALINRYGFRVSVMTGSVLCSFSKLFSHFATSFPTLYLFYGWINGFGCAFVSMSSNLVVGFYFQRLRNLALIIAAGGQSFGIMAMSPLNSYLSRLAGWRTTVLLHSGLLGLTFFFGMTFKPILSVTVIKTEDQDIEAPTATVTKLPHFETKQTSKGRRASVGERFFSAHSNARFPTAKRVADERISISESPQTSRAARVSDASKLILKVNRPDENSRHLSQLESMKSDFQVKNMPVQFISTHKEEHPKRGCCDRCCHWEKTAKESRPLYRDDAFYEGDIKDLPAYKEHVTDIPEDQRTGLEYQLAVSRTVATKDIEEKKGLNAIAVRRVLVSMLDPSLFKKRSFVVLCIAGFVSYIGLLVPVVYLPVRNASAGLPPVHCGLFLSVVGLSNAIGRIMSIFIVSKIHPVTYHAFALWIIGLSTILSTLSYNLYFQYGYCIIFGLALAGISGIRSVMLVSLFGLEKLTNTAGFMLIFLGLGYLISTPFAGFLKKYAGFDVAFWVAGTLLFLSGFIVLVSKKLVKGERDN